MFSGGLDSTAMLVKLLAEPREEMRDELHVHHIRMINKEKRDLAEQRAVEAVVAYCRARYRPFRYSESGLDFSGALEAIPIDYLSIAFVACQVAIDTPACKRVAVGALAADTDIANRSARQKRVFEEMYACYRARKLGEPQRRMDLPGVPPPQGRAGRGPAAGAPQADVVLSAAARGLSPLRHLQGVSRAAGLAYPHGRSRESGLRDRGGAP